MSVHTVMQKPKHNKTAPTSSGILQRKTCSCGRPVVAGGDCAECQKKRLYLQRRAVNQAGPTTAPPIVHDVLRSPGRPLDPSTRTYMEPRFSHDFSRVRVHTDAKASDSARAVNALAYTVGRDVVFGAGQYSPQTQRGRKLLGHELTHVMQQRNHVGYQPRQIVSQSADRYEREADRVASHVIDGKPGAVQVSNADLGIQRTIGDGHDLTATRFAGNQRLEAVYDNERLIRRGNSGVAIRIIQESLLAQGYAFPVFGADGDFGAETEAAIRQFQIDTGAEKLDGIVGPETMKLLDMHDPGGTTGTPQLGPAPPAMFTWLSESPDEQFAGYDAVPNPDALVVPVNGRRQVNALVQPANANPTYVVSNNPGNASVDTIPDGIVVTGLSDGPATIEAREGATVLDTLDVEVKTRRDIPVDYHFMRDTAAPPQPQHRTVRSTADAPTLTSTLNQVWERQANVRFRTGTVDTPTIGANLGGQVLWAAGPANEWNTITAFATPGNWNVFLVWEYEQDATPLVDNTNAGTLGSNTLLEDNECGDALTIAHEAGHFMGIPTHAPSGIMSGCPGNNRRRVFKADADRVNP